MANLFVNNGTTWVSVKQPYVNNAGSFTPAKAVYVHNGTSWTQVFYRFAATISSNTISYNLRTAAIADGWNGTSKLNATINVNSGVVVSGTGNNTSAAINLNGLVTESVVTINNSGTIVGSGGTYGSMQQNGSVNTTWANGNGLTAIGTTGYTYIGTGGNAYGNYSNTIYYYGYGIGGNWPVYNSFSGGTGPANGGDGASGGTAIYLASNISLIINNASTGLVVGGGGGAGGMGGNNRGGGAGGNGGYLIEETGAHPAAIVNNTSGGILASGGGGAGGWGNRYEGEGHGGYYGESAIGIFWTGAGATPGISPGLATNNTGTKIINTSGTYTLSPAV